MADRVMDGTSCGPYEADLCVNGRCQRIGCDGIISSSAKEDRCGVCNGDGLSCRIVRGDFNHTKGMGYIEAVVIPAGARRIKVVEDKPSHSFLALKDSSEGSINSDWKIELPGEFELAGTTVRYVRRGLWEKMSAKGPTKAPLHLMVLLFHDQSYGIHYEYTVSLNTTQGRDEDLYIWTHSSWQDCSVQCGGDCGQGVHKRTVSCTNPQGVCDPLSQPTQEEPCENHSKCYEWKTGDWSKCSSSCGKGLQSRVVQCMHKLTGRHGNDCSVALRPPTYRPCHRGTCNEKINVNTITSPRLAALTYKCMGDQWTVYCRVIREKNLCQDMRWYQRCCETCRDFYANQMLNKS
ncbi:A disintegrin and metalloproteinase with thrombospondin motifs 19 [Liparis tanakae]|uniref:A disintegrin and metalloproteinase with thrombospondin motifs 19 n=1 Tax=Liparis tanakae TaxID=230148 RepID=A0A4Z2ICI9_9TELE|nr:A disintegrin and metalloproteinase with thrombospondin motifs 19 [Liparis tanakae]